MRAWDKTTNQMRGCYGFNDMEQEVYVCSVADDEFNGRLKTVHALKRSFDEVVVMQSTGLEDKNGVEIFEGDVIKHIDFESNECAVNVVYMKHGSLVFDVKIDGGVYTVPVYSIHPEASRGYEDILEVIGNIYKNPELLEVTE